MITISVDVHEKESADSSIHLKMFSNNNEIISLLQSDEIKFVIKNNHVTISTAILKNVINISASEIEFDMEAATE